MSERADTLKLCTDVALQLCDNLHIRDRILVREFLEQLTNCPESIVVEEVEVVTDDGENPTPYNVTSVTYEAKFKIVGAPVLWENRRKLLETGPK